MRLFVTGGSGFIGGYVLRELKERGHGYVALRRTKPSGVGGGGMVDGDGGRWLTKPMQSVCREDMGGVDALIHLAAAGVSPQRATIEEMFQVNVVDSLGLWRIASDAGVRKWVIVGSSHEYGRSAARYAFIPSDAPLEPTTGYGASKAGATMAAVALALERQVALTVVRPFNCYGDGQHAVNLWPSVRSAALAGRDFPMSSGRPVRDFIAVESVARSIVDIATDGRVAASCEMKNLGTGRAMSVKEFVDAWWSHWNAKGKVIAGALPDRKHEPERIVAKPG